MDKSLKNLFIFLMGLGAVIDAFTTFVGLATVINPTREHWLRLLFCVGPAVVVLGLLLMTRYIWKKLPTDLGMFALIFQAGWLVALGYDIWTSFTANLKVVTLDQGRLLEQIDVMSVLKSATIEQLFAVALGTILVSGSPILFSFLLEE